MEKKERTAHSFLREDLTSRWIIVILLAVGSTVIFTCGCRQKSSEAGVGVSFGVLTDVHYGNKVEAIGRYYRDSLAKLSQAVETFNQQELAFCVHLGDMVDSSGSSDLELVWLKTILAEFGRFEGPFYFVLGNHDMSELSKAEFLSACQMPASHYTFNHGRFHFIVLDACFKADGSDYDSGNFTWTESFLSAGELEWLRKDLMSTDRPTIIFSHQRLDNDGGDHGIGNARATREILEDSGRVLAVIQGHDHGGGYSRINGLDYFTLQAMVTGPGLENNAFVVIRIDEDNTVVVEGFGKQPDWTAPVPEHRNTR